MLWSVFVIVWLVSISCGTRVPIVTTPEYPDFIFPGIPTTYSGGLQLQDQQSAWAFLQTGDLNTAELRFEELLEVENHFFPAITGLGWVDLAEGRFQEAADQFRLALDQKKDYVPALVGYQVHKFIKVGFRASGKPGSHQIQSELSKSHQNKN